MRFVPALLLLLFLLTAGGCAETRTFQVAVRNETNRPLTLGLAKEGGKYEPQWQTPEQAAIHTDSKDERGWDSVVCPPGEVRSAGPVKGDFSGMALATVRVYSGDLGLSDVLAISRDSPDRVDVPLEEGRNAIIIREEAGKLAYSRVKVPPPAKK